MELYEIILIAIIVLVASYTQTVTGFGFGIVAMIFLPNILLYTEANILSSILSTIVSALIVFSTFKNINWKNLIFPLIGSFVFNYLAITFVKNANNQFLILLLGIALVLLSTYFFFFSTKIKIRPSWYTGLLAGAISGVLSGLFSIGGPPVVLYYLQSEDNTERYLATISAYFVLSGIISVAMKTMSSFMTTNVLIGLGVGILAMIIGSILGKTTRKKLNPQIIRKVVYLVMAISGIINVVTSLI